MTAEATPHHFALADADMAPYDSNYKMKPPLRSACDVGAVVAGRGLRSHRRHRHRSRAARRAAKRCRSSRSARSASSAWRPRWAWRSNGWCIPARSRSTRLVELFTTGPARILGSEPRHVWRRARPAMSRFSTPSASGPTTSTSRSRRAATRRSTDTPSAAARWPPSSTAASSGPRIANWSKVKPSRD